MLWKLLWYNIKMTYRDKQAIFWSLVFPLMFIIIFGLFDFERMGDAKYIAIDNAQSPIATQFLDGFNQIEFLKRQEFSGTLDEARVQLTEGEIDFVLLIPRGFALPDPGDPAATAPVQPTPLQVYYDEGNMLSNQVALSVVDKFVDSMNMQIGQTQQLFTYTAESVQTKDVRYIDMIMPGILGMSLMNSAVIGIATGISRYRERKLLKRLSATPLKVRDFLIAEVLSYLAMTLVQIALIIILARLAFGVQVYGNYLYLFILALLGSIIFLNIGFAVAGYSKNTKTAEAMSQIVTMPMMFFSGVFFSTETLPKVVAKVVGFLPLTPLIDALRAVSINAENLSALGTELGFMAAWVVASFLLAWKTFRFKD
ncbi:MAG: ABC transporter permease [Candidatus Kerfeldbacteria bacterium]|nr:ABC transporter permease [Candidatus Kerfeldbacteria bacterium]